MPPIRITRAKKTKPSPYGTFLTEDTLRAVLTEALVPGTPISDVAALLVKIQSLGNAEKHITAMLDRVDRSFVPAWKFVDSMPLTTQEAFAKFLERGVNKKDESQARIEFRDSCMPPDCSQGLGYTAVTIVYTAILCGYTKDQIRVPQTIRDDLHNVLGRIAPSLVEKYGRRKRPLHQVCPAAAPITPRLVVRKLGGSRENFGFHRLPQLHLGAALLCRGGWTGPKIGRFIVCDSKTLSLKTLADCGPERAVELFMKFSENSASTDRAVFDSETCVVCLSEPPSVIMFTCMHKAMCQECAARVDECPMCRTQTDFVFTNSTP